MQLSKAQILDLFDFAHAAEAVRAAYIASANGTVQAPEVTYLGFPQAQGDCHVKTAHMQGAPVFVIKIATGFYGNPAKGLPSSNGMNLLFSAETGALVATLQDEGWLTDMRTGLGGAIATHALAPEGFDHALIVGTGIQARLQARCLQALRPGAPIAFAIWGRRPEAMDQTVADLEAEGLTARAAPDLQTACAAARVIVTTTPAQSPLIEADWIRPGTHITAVGADCPGKQELSTDLASGADLLVADLPAQCLDHGEFQTSHAAGLIDPDAVVSLGAVLSGESPGRTGSEQISVADLTGLAAQDAAISMAILEAALAQTERPPA